MQRFLLPVLLLCLCLPVQAIDSNIKRSLEQLAVPSSDTTHTKETDLPFLSRGLVGQNDTSVIAIPSTAATSFLWLNFQDLNWTYTTTIKVTKPTANRALIWPDASGTVLLTGSSAQAITNPTITNGLTASGSVSNDFSGSTGTFKTSTGATTIGPGAVTISGALINGYASYNASGAGTVSLTAAQSGDNFLLDAATGVVYTLPAPVVGLNYTFQVTVTNTSNSHEVRTNTGTVFIEGVILNVCTTAANSLGFLANGSTHQAIKMNGTTTGGYIGTQFTLTCVSATEWMISGTVLTSGTAATPFTATP